MGHFLLQITGRVKIERDKLENEQKMTTSSWKQVYQARIKNLKLIAADQNGDN